MLGLYVTVFGFIFGGSFDVLPAETPVDYTLGIFLGLTLFHFIDGSFALAPGLIVSPPQLRQEGGFPPRRAAGIRGGHRRLPYADQPRFGVDWGTFVWPRRGRTALWLPLILLPEVFMDLGLTLAISALGVFWRDLRQVSQFLTLGQRREQSCPEMHARMSMATKVAWSFS